VLAATAATAARSHASFGLLGAPPSERRLAIRYVAFDDPSGRPALPRAAAEASVRSVNRIWAQCGISFQLEQYRPVAPADYRLEFGLADMAELDDVRNAFAEDDALLVVVTGKWRRSGSLGESAANAWTSMPGGPPYGAILEAPVAGFAGLVAHELGHYLGLSHERDVRDLMSSIIYTDSTRLTPGECSTARAVADADWKRMER
jgi:hypothetical protein